MAVVHNKPTQGALTILTQTKVQFFAFLLRYLSYLVEKNTEQTIICYGESYIDIGPAQDSLYFHWFKQAQLSTSAVSCKLCHSMAANEV